MTQVVYLIKQHITTISPISYLQEIILACNFFFRVATAIQACITLCISCIALLLIILIIYLFWTFPLYFDSDSGEREERQWRGRGDDMQQRAYAGFKARPLQ